MLRDPTASETADGAFGGPADEPRRTLLAVSASGKPKADRELPDDSVVRAILFYPGRQGMDARPGHPPEAPRLPTCVERLVLSALHTEFNDLDEQWNGPIVTTL